MDSSSPWDSNSSSPSRMDCSCCPALAVPAAGRGRWSRGRMDCSSRSPMDSCRGGRPRGAGGSRRGNRRRRKAPRPGAAGGAGPPRPEGPPRSGRRRRRRRTRATRGRRSGQRPGPLAVGCGQGRGAAMDGGAWLAPMEGGAPRWCSRPPGWYNDNAMSPAIPGSAAMLLADAATCCLWCEEPCCQRPGRGLCPTCHAQPGLRRMHRKGPVRPPGWDQHLFDLRARARARLPLFGR
jgi:hypothetical protein